MCCSSSPASCSPSVLGAHVFDVDELPAGRVGGHGHGYLHWRDRYGSLRALHHRSVSDDDRGVPDGGQAYSEDGHSHHTERVCRVGGHRVHPYEHLHRDLAVLHLWRASGLGRNLHPVARYPYAHEPLVQEERRFLHRYLHGYDGRRWRYLELVVHRAEL